MQYTTRQRGLADMFQSIISPGARPEQSAYEDTMLRLYQGENAKQSARVRARESQILEDQLKARAALAGMIPPAGGRSPQPGGGASPGAVAALPPGGGAPGPMPGPSPSAGPSVGGLDLGNMGRMFMQMMLSSGQMNPSQFASGMQTVQQMGYSPEAYNAVRAGDGSLAAQLQAMATGQAMPAQAASGGYGSTYDRFSGQQIEAGAIPQAQQAQLGSAYASAASGRAADALAEQRGFLTAGDTVYQINPPPARWQGIPNALPPEPGPPLSRVAGPDPAVSGGSSDEPAKIKTMEYLARMYQMPPFNLPRDQAIFRAEREATNNVRVVTTPTGAALFDTGNMSLLGTFDARGNFAPAGAGGAPAAMGGAAPAGGPWQKYQR